MGLELVNYLFLTVCGMPWALAILLGVHLWGKHRTIPRGPSVPRRGLAWALLAAITFVATSISFSYLQAEVEYVFLALDLPRGGHMWENGRVVGDYWDSDLEVALDKHKRGIIAQLWLHYLLPPGIGQDCYDESPEVCSLMSLATQPSDKTWGSAVLGLVAGIEAVIGWEILQRRKNLQATHAQG